MKTERNTRPETKVRLNRYLSMCGISSRRKADDLIVDGKVSLNGSTVRDLGVRIDPQHDKIFVDGKQVVQIREPVYLVLNKPKDTITTLHDERGRSTIMDLVHFRDRVYPVGRLDRNTTGVLLLTNDGEFANRITHPRYGVEKTYLVRVAGQPTTADLDRLKKGVYLSEGFCRVQSITAKKRQGKSTDLVMVLNEGRNRELRRILARVGHKVLRLKRFAVGPIKLADLPTGAWRKLLPAYCFSE